MVQQGGDRAFADLAEVELPQINEIINLQSNLWEELCGKDLMKCVLPPGNWGISSLGDELMKKHEIARLDVMECMAMFV